MEHVAWLDAGQRTFEMLKPYLPWVGGSMIALWGRLRSGWTWSHTIMLGILLTASLFIIVERVSGLQTVQSKIHTWGEHAGYVLQPDPEDGAEFRFILQSEDSRAAVPIYVLRRRGHRAVIIQAILDVTPGRAHIPMQQEDSTDFERLKSILQLYLVQAGVQYVTTPSAPDRIVIEDVLFDGEDLNESHFLRRLSTVQSIGKAAWLQFQLSVGL